MNSLSSLGTTLLSSFHRSSNATYDAVEDDGKDNDSDTAFFFQEEEAIERERKPLSATPWIIATILYTIVTIVMWFNLARPTGNIGSYETGWATDFIPPRSEIEIEVVQFDGDLNLDANGTMFIQDIGPVDPMTYQSTELDEEWDSHGNGSWIRITEKEAKVAWPGKFKEFYDEKREGYAAVLDMFYALECLSHIRKNFYTEASLEDGEGWDKIHDSQCFEHIRQYIMCAGDLTPLPTKYVPTVGRNVVQSNYAHTCRNFEKLKDWTERRSNGDLMVHPYNRGD